MRRADLRHRLPQRAAVPDWPGLDDFEGPKFHTSRWEHEHDLTGKTVAVVGPVQRRRRSSPRSSRSWGKMYLFQREPGWVMPKGDRDFTTEERARAAQPGGCTRERRLKWYWAREAPLQRRHLPAGDEDATDAREQAAASYIDASSPTIPTSSAAVTPNYPYPGQATDLQLSTFYPALKQPNVELVPRAVASVTRDGVVDVDGVERAVDVLVHGDRVPAHELPRPFARSSVATGARCTSTGTASRARSSASPCRSSRTSSCSTVRAPTAARS